MDRDLVDPASLTDEWQEYPQGSGQYGLVRRLDEDRYVGVIPFLFTWGVVVGRLGDVNHFYDDRWCYDDLNTAVLAATVWEGKGEPTGWHRHLGSGRRRPDGDASREHVAP